MAGRRWGLFGLASLGESANSVSRPAGKSTAAKSTAVIIRLVHTLGAVTNDPPFGSPQPVVNPPPASRSLRFWADNTE